jgi:hypothetical protein
MPQKHVKVCAKVNAKRKVYSAVAMRVGGTEAAQFVKEKVRENKALRKAGKMTVEEQKKAEKASKGAKFKADSASFRDAMKAAREVSKAEKDGTLSSLPPPKATVDHSLVPCPTCGRTFNEQALERHAGRCAKITENSKARGKFQPKSRVNKY